MSVCLEIWGTKQNPSFTIASFSILHHQGFGSFFSFLEDFCGSLVTSELAVHGRVQILSVFFLNAFQHSEMGIQSPVPTYIPSAAGYVPLLWHPKEPSVEQAWMNNMLMWSGSTFQPRVPDPPNHHNGFLFPQVPLDFRQLWTATLKISLPIVL